MFNKFKNLFYQSVEKLYDRLADHTDKSFLSFFLRKLITLHPLTHALYHYRMGSMVRAQKILARRPPKNTTESNFYVRVEEISRIAENGFQLDISGGTQPQAWNYKVLFALHCSLPYDEIGYTIRSHSILKNLKKQKIDVLAATRLSYPLDLGKHAHKAFEKEDLIDGIRYVRILDEKDWRRSPDTEYINAYADKLAQAARAHKASVIHASSDFLNGLAAVKAACQTGAKCIYEMRGLWHLTRSVKEPSFTDTDHFRYCEFMEIAAARGADRVVVISETLRNWLIERRIIPEKITVVPNAVDTTIFSPLSPDITLKKKLGLEAKTLVGFIGSLTEYEGIDYLIRAVSSLISQGEDIALLIVGSGEAKKQLQKIAETFPYKKNIYFTGHVSFRDIKKYYSIIDIYPFPRKNYPVCQLVPPLKVLEVMAMEKPVIVSDVAALLEMVKDGETGMVCKADDVLSLQEAISSLLKSPDTCTVLGTESRKWVMNNRSWKNITKQYLEIYSAACRHNN